MRNDYNLAIVSGTVTKKADTRDGAHYIAILCEQEHGRRREQNELTVRFRGGKLAKDARDTLQPGDRALVVARAAASPMTDADGRTRATVILDAASFQRLQDTPTLIQDALTTMMIFDEADNALETERENDPAEPQKPEETT